MFHKICTGLTMFSLAFVLLACNDTKRGQEQTEITALPEAGYLYEPYECPFDPGEEKVSCGYLIVPEARGDVDGGAMIELAVAVLKSHSDNPKPDPILYLEGGPGGSALVGYDSWLESPLRNERDIILFDQRGTGYSIPSLQCPELFEYEEELEAMAACRDRFTDEGIDLSAYNSANSAADINDLRQALDIPEWNLLGISYGTRLALTVMRDHPTGIRSVILDSVYPPNVDAYTEQPRNNADAIQALLDGCEADDDCHESYPALSRTFYQLLAQLDNEPIVLEEEEVDGSGFVSFMINALYDTETIPTLPMLIYEASQGNYDLFLEFNGGGEEGFRAGLSQDEDDSVGEGDGMFHSVECNEEIPFGDPEKAKALVADYPPALAGGLVADLESLYQTCQLWGAGKAGAIEDLAVGSDIPTLLLAGEYDPVTPPSWAKLAAESLTNHYLYVLPRAGHSLMDAGECPMQIIQDFLDTPSSEPDSQCVQEMILPFETE